LSWVPPEGAKSIVIFGDNDSLKNYEGQVAAYEKARKLRLKGFDVEVMIPPNPGDDWNDVWGEAQTAKVA
jgi:putative DNA primase/helicase